MRGSLLRSLLLCIDLYRNWADLRLGFVNLEDRDTLREAVVAAAKEHFTEATAAALAAALAGPVPDSVYQRGAASGGLFAKSVCQVGK